MLAQEEARVLDHNHIGTEHLLLGLIHEGDGVAARALHQLGLEETAVRAEVERRVGRGDGMQSGHVPFTPRAKKALEQSLREALQLGHNYIGTEHLLLGVMNTTDSTGARVLSALGADPEAIRSTTLEIMGGMKPGTEPVGATAALCPSCRLPLAGRLGVQAVAVTLETSEPIDQQVMVAYCRSCGCSVGLVAASPPSPPSPPSVEPPTS